MKDIFIKKGITKILFKAGLALAVMFTIMSLNSITVKAESKTINVSELTTGGTIIRKGDTLIRDEEDSSVYYLNWGMGEEDPYFAICNEDNQETFRNNVLLWTVGDSFPAHTGGTKPEWYDTAEVFQVRDPHYETEYGYWNIYLSKDIHTHNFTEFEAIKDYIYAHCADKENCTLGKDGTEAGDEYAGAKGIAYIQIESTSENCAFFSEGYLKRFNDATGKNVSENDLKYYKTKTKGATEGGTELPKKPTEKGYYYATLTVEGVTAKRAFEIIESPAVEPESTTLTPLTFTAEEAGSTVFFNWTSGTDMMYSTDGSEWNNLDGKEIIIELKNVGDKVSFRGKNVTGAHFVLNDGKIAASGDVTSLTNGIGGDVALTNGCYASMFSACTDLTSAPSLPSTTLAEGCYSGMFNMCTSLASAPELPATTLADSCYLNMFWECTSLSSAPTLPATTLEIECYQNMFIGCTGLTSAPELPATTLAANCYASMFEGCTGLTSAPALPATTLETGCYAWMFKDCTGLSSAPALPATTLINNCYASMFEGCTSLSSVPALKATNLFNFCYADMFNGCTGFKVVETTDESEATWVFPQTSAYRWNENMISSLTAPGTLTEVEGGKMYKVIHIKHSFTYSASGSTLTVSCLENCSLKGNKAELTLTAEDMDYSGSAYTGASIEDTAAWTSVGLSVPVIKYTGRGATTYEESETAPVESGTYTAKITVEGATASCAFEIIDPEKPSEEPVNQEIIIENPEDLSTVIEAISSITDNSSTEETPVVTLKMENGVTKVTKEVFAALQESDNDIVIVLDMGNYKWTIDSADITGTPTDIDFSVKIGDEAETIEIDVINEVTGKEEKKSINISLTHSGDFKCKPTLTVNVEEENKGYYANLFYYNPSTKKLEYVCAGRIKSNGDVDLKFSHASDYAIIISDKDMNPDDSAKNESKKSDKKKEEKKDKNKETVYVDYDTMKSELVAGTILMFDLNDLTKFKDMKVFTPDKTVMANQKFLADYYAGQMGKKAKILHTYNVHPKSDLQIGEAGTKKMFAWNNLAIKTPGAIYAVCYNQKDGAYLLSGTLDNKGTAILPYFIMNEATTVTLFTVE